MKKLLSLEKSCTIVIFKHTVSVKLVSKEKRFKRKRERRRVERGHKRLKAK